MNIMKKKIQADKNGCKYVLFRIDIFFSECFLAVEIDKKGHTEKLLGCKFIRINTSNAKNGYDEVGKVQAFIDEFKNKKIKKNRKRNEIESRKRNEREIIKRIKRQK